MAVAQVSARPSVMGSPRPTTPALVWTLRNSQRGLTRKVSRRVILTLSFTAGRFWIAALVSVIVGALKALSPASEAAVALSMSRRVSWFLFSFTAVSFKDQPRSNEEHEVFYLSSCSSLLRG